MTLREGRGSALTVSLKEAPDKLWDEQYRKRVVEVLLNQLQSLTISITQSAIRSCGYIFEYLLLQGKTIPSPLLVAFVRVSLVY